eukprot:TRINITY_DN61688_c0_g1_i1.p1 TRINITY_DN61688_c0_g1~~TRINITY_DN61688_c0_g1_i1.p1  ORF type:complete len:186 (+),score=26.81 TRINITY_DN61688_c0_g1_i1:138-695(+)
MAMEEANDATGSEPVTPGIIDASSGGAAPSGGGKGNKKRKRGNGDSETQFDLVGTIRMFNADKGWGFIDGDAGGKDIFLHAKHFVGKAPNYWIGHKMQTKDKHVAPRMPEGPVRVLFDMSLTSQGKPQALNVRITSGGVETGSEDESDDDRGTPRHRSPTCHNCGSTIASRLGLSVCILCGAPLT